MRFQANEIEAEACDDEYVAYACFADRTAPAGHYVMLNRSVTPGAGSELFLEVDDQARTVAGGIASCRLSVDRVVIVLDPQAAKIVGAAEIEVEFEISAERMDRLRKAMAGIFENHSDYQDLCR